MKPDREPFETELSQALKQVAIPGDLKAFLRGLPNQSPDALSASSPAESAVDAGDQTLVEFPTPLRQGDPRQMIAKHHRSAGRKRWRVRITIGAVATCAAAVLLVWSLQVFSSHQLHQAATIELANRDTQSLNSVEVIESNKSLKAIQQQLQDLELEWMWIEEQRVLARINQLNQARPPRLGLESDERIALTLVTTAETTILAGNRVPSTFADLKYVLTNFPDTSAANQAQALLGQLKF